MLTVKLEALLRLHWEQSLAADGLGFRIRLLVLLEEHVMLAVRRDDP